MQISSKILENQIEKHILPQWENEFVLCIFEKQRPEEEKPIYLMKPHE